MSIFDSAPRSITRKPEEFQGVFGLQGLGSLLQLPGPKKLKLSKIELTYKAKKFKVPPLTK